MTVLNNSWAPWSSFLVRRQHSPRTEQIDTPLAWHSASISCIKCTVVSRVFHFLEAGERSSSALSLASVLFDFFSSFGGTFRIATCTLFESGRLEVLGGVGSSDLPFSCPWNVFSVEDISGAGFNAFLGHSIDLTSFLFISKVFTHTTKRLVAWVKNKQLGRAWDEGGWDARCQKFGLKFALWLGERCQQLKWSAIALDMPGTWSAWILKNKDWTSTISCEGSIACPQCENNRSSGWRHCFQCHKTWLHDDREGLFPKALRPP